MSSESSNLVGCEMPGAPVDHEALESNSVSATQEAPSFKLYQPPVTPASNSDAASSAGLPDSYFEPTTTELKAAFDSQRKLREKLTNAPLKTEAMRQSEEKMKLNRWPNTTIRVKFPDRTQLEKTFSSSEKIKSIYAFVRNSLREDVKSIKFILYQAPPRKEFKVSDPEVRDKTLAQLSLSPSSVLLLTFFDDSLNVPTLRAPLSEDVWKHAQELPLPPTFDDPPSTPNVKRKNPSGGTSEKKGVPKWLKLSKK